MIDKKYIKKAIEKRKNYLGIKEIKSLKVSRIGMGENNLNYLTEINGQKFVFRIALRKRVEKNMEREFNSLKEIPKGFGPEPVYFDKTRKIIKNYYTILRYMEGEHREKWGKKELNMHAKKLAELHKDKKNFWMYNGKKQKGKIDLYKLFLDEIKIYRKETPKKFSKDYEKLISIIKNKLKEKNPLLKKIKRFSRVHMDPCLTNILFTKKGIKYIDWEWTGYGDNALDVAMLFDDQYAQPPWKLKLSKKEIDMYLNSYLKHNPDKTLKERVRAWVIFFKGIDLLFFRFRAKHYTKSDLPKSKYVKDYKVVKNAVKKL